MNPELLKLAFLGEAKGRSFKVPGRVRLTLGRKSAIVPAILDTGAGATIISFNMLRKLGIRPEDLEASNVRFGIRRGMTSYTVWLDGIELEGLPGCRVGRYPVRAQSFVLGSAPFGEVMLCGIDLIQMLRMKIAVQSKDPKTVLKVLCGGLRDGNPRDFERKYATGQVTFQSGRKKVTTNCIFDTGATFVSIPPRIAEVLKLKPRPLSVKAIGVTAMLTLAETKVDSVVLEGTRCGVKNMTVFVLRGVPYPIIGVDFMKSTGLVLDFTGDSARLVCPK